LKYFLLAALIQAIWGLTPSASRVVLESLSVDVFVALRFSISALIFCTLLLVKRTWKPLRLKTFVQLAVIGIFTFGIASFLTLTGLKMGGVVNFALASSMSPLLVGFLSHFVLKERLTKWFFASLPFYGIGILFLAYGKGVLSGSSIAWTSLLVITSAYLCEGIGFIFSKKVSASVPLLQYMAILQFFGSAFAWGVVIWSGHEIHLESLHSVQWLSLTFVSTISCCLLFLSWYWLLHFIQAHRLGFFEAFHVLSAALFGYILFNEPWNYWMVCGGGLLLMSVILVNKKVLPS
jgi:drug/metabolite transporter (DMT)-like permease